MENNLKEELQEELGQLLKPEKWVKKEYVWIKRMTTLLDTPVQLLINLIIQTTNHRAAT